MWLRDAGTGAIAGALGTLAINVSAYADVAARGRPPSEVPSRTVAEIEQRSALDLGEGDTAQNRRTGIGALMGYATGITAGAVFGVVRGRVRRLPAPVAGVALGAAVMAASDTSAVVAGVTDPRTWGVAGWLADVVPHVIYGVVTTLAFDRLS